MYACRMDTQGYINVKFHCVKVKVSCKKKEMVELKFSVLRT